MRKHIAFTIIISVLVTPFSSRAQTKKNDWQYYFNGGVGYYFPLTARTSLSESGSVSSFQFQVDYKERLFGRLFFDQYSIAFHTKYIQGLGANFKINRYFILYLEPQYMSFPVKTQVYNGNLDGVSLQLGFKTPLQ